MKLSYPDFRQADFLRNHIQSILDFYQPNVLDKNNGGYHHNFYDDGSIFGANEKHLVSSCRIIFNYCKAYQTFKDEDYLEKAKHGLSFLLTQHWDESRQGYNWVLNGDEPVDQTNHCYGLAFVILALAACVESGIDSALAPLYQAWDILNQRLWQSETGIYADEASADWQTVGEYRGQNANMHCCEAFITAYQATKDKQFLNRALSLAKTVTIDLTATTQGLIWEHYHTDLSIDWEYNLDDPKNLYRPWGFQPGHQTEWTKLLLILYQYQPESWLLDKAENLFNQALDTCWDNTHGGILYGFAPDKTICDDDKYFWVQAESFAAAAMLAQATGNEKYWQWYDRIWEYSWEHFIDHTHGAWYRVLKANNTKYSNQKSTAGGKCDYHTMSACYQVLDSLTSAKLG